MTIKLLAQDFSAYGEPDAVREVGSFSTQSEALAAAQSRVDACLEELFTTGISAESLIRQWSLFGEDVFLSPDEGEPPFSAMAYATVCSRKIIDRL